MILKNASLNDKLAFLLLQNVSLCKMAQFLSKENSKTFKSI
jgi:hypothetical protein